MFLHFFPLCSNSLPQVGQARTEGQSFTSFMISNEIYLHVSKRSTPRSAQPSLSHRSARGILPFHSFKHCQQNTYVLPILLVQTLHSTLKLRVSSLSTNILQPGQAI
uniref:Uncharacterized protein n=1 Tax=Anguilla anguilla TaxID=7936 RepID=A0A0E9XWF9_ANGAN